MTTHDRKPKRFRVIYRPRPRAILHAMYFDTAEAAGQWLKESGHPGRVEEAKFGHGWVVIT